MKLPYIFYFRNTPLKWREKQIYLFHGNLQEFALLLLNEYLNFTD